MNSTTTRFVQRRQWVAPLMLILMALPAISAPVAVPGFTHTGGGGQSVGGRFKLTGSIGQPFVAISTSATYRLPAGFWRPAAMDRTPPIVLCPANIIANADPGQCSKTNVTYTASASDDSPGVIATCTPASGSTFVVGTTTVTCTATDAAMNVSTCTFTVTVGDVPPPIIACPVPMVTNVCGSSVIVHYPSPLVTAGVLAGCFPPSGSLFGVGITPVICTALNACRSNSCTFGVTVVSNCVTSCLAMTLPANVTVPCQGPGGSFASFEVSATNSCRTEPVVVLCSPPSGSLFPIGTTTVHCQAYGRLATNSGSFAVLVSGNCVEPRATITLATNQSDMRLRTDRLVYRPGSTLQVELNLGSHRLGTALTHVVLVSERGGDLEVVPVRRRVVEQFMPDANTPLAFGAVATRLDGTLQIARNDTIWAFWLVEGLVAGAVVGEDFVVGFALASDGGSSDAPQQVLPELALTPDERIVPPGGKPITTLFVPGTLPIQAPVDELIVYPRSDAELAEIVRVTGGRVLAANLLPEQVAQGQRPTSYLIHVNPLAVDAGELPVLRSFVAARRPLLASSDAGLRITTLALRLQLLGYRVSLNPRLAYAGTPAISAVETANLPEASTHELMNLPRVWAFMALMDADTQRMPVAFLDQGFSVNSDFRRPAGGVIRQCDFEGRTLSDLFRGFACLPGSAESTPTTGASLVGDLVWHGNGVVGVAGGVVNNGFGVAGTGGQVVEPILYRYGVTSYAFEMGLGLQRAILDQAKVANISASFPCKIVTWLGLDPVWCSRGGRALFCLELPLHLGYAAGIACEAAVDCDPGFFCDVAKAFARAACTTAGAIAGAAAIPVCEATLPAIPDLRDPLEEGIVAARDNGIPVVTVAGNELSPESLPEFIRPLVDLTNTRVEDWEVWPAMQPDTIVCGATESDFPFVNLEFQGNRVDIWAPITSHYYAPSGLAVEPNDALHIRHPLSGTSAAAPYISGLIANMMALNPRLDPHNPDLTPEQRARIPGLIKALLKTSAYSQVALRELAPDALRTATFEAGAMRRNLVNPVATINNAAFQILEGMSAPAQLRFTELGYDGEMNFDETTELAQADTPAHARRLSVGELFTGTIMTIRDDGATGARALQPMDRDYFSFQTPVAPGIYQALIELTVPKKYEYLQVRGSSREIADGIRVGDTPVERTLRYRTAPLLSEAGSFIELTGAGGADNVYKVRLVGFDRVGDLPVADLFDRNDASTPPESRPNNNVMERGGLLGRPGDSQWRSETSESGSILRNQVIRLFDLNLHNATDVDWFCVAPPIDFTAGPCGSTLTIQAAPGIRITVYHRGRPDVIVAEGVERLSLPTTLLENTELCLKLTASEPGRYLRYNLDLRLSAVTTQLCDVLRRTEDAGVGSGTSGRIDRSSELPFPGTFPELPAGLIPRCDPRVCDPAVNGGLRALDSFGRILTPDSYLIEWNTFGAFNALLEFVAGGSLRARLLNSAGQVVATASSLSDTNYPPMVAPALHLRHDALLPGYYVLKVDLGFRGTRIAVTLPHDATTPGSLAFEDTGDLRTQPVLPTFTNWLRATIPDLTDLSPEADADQDGLNNYQEYLFGSHPGIAGDARRPELRRLDTGNKGELALRFVRPTWIHGVDYFLKGTPVLDPSVPWQTLQPTHTLCRPIDPGLEEVTWIFNWPVEMGFFAPLGYAPVPVPVIEPPAAGASLRIGFFNAQFLAEPIVDDSPCADVVEDRARVIADRIIQTGFDVIGLCEVQLTSAKDDLADVLYEHGYHYYVWELDESTSFFSADQDSGLMLFSKFPFVRLPVESLPDRLNPEVIGKFTYPCEPGDSGFPWVAFTEFEEACDLCIGCFGCVGDDCKASKGAGLVRIRHPSGTTFNVVFTHLQSDYGPEEQCAKATQLGEIKHMINVVLGDLVTMEPVIVMGDLNISGGDTDSTTPGIQHNQEYLDRFGTSGHFEIRPDVVLNDVWLHQNEFISGLADHWRDEGKTSSVCDTSGNGGISRLDYIFINSSHVQNLAVQHMARAYGLKANPFRPAAFGEEGRQTLSDHFGIIADINVRTDHCSPQTAIPIDRIELTPSTPTTVIERDISVAGGMEWMLIEKAGTYTISLESTDGAVVYQVYASFELSRPLHEDSLLDASPGRGKSMQTFTSPGGCPLLIRISHRDRSGTGAYRLIVEKHFGLIRDTAIQLHANAKAVEAADGTIVPWAPALHGGHVEVHPGIIGETGQRWFRAATETATSGASQTLRIKVFPLDDKIRSVRWITHSGRILEEIITPPPESVSSREESFVGGEDTFIVVEFESGATGFRVEWDTDLTVLLLDGPVLSQHGNNLAIVCKTTTDGFLCGEDDAVRLTVQLSSGLRTIPVAGPGRVADEIDDENQVSIGRFFSDTVRFVPRETLQIRLDEDDFASACAPSDMLKGELGDLDRDTEFDVHVNVILLDDSRLRSDGWYYFQCRLAHRSR